MGKGGGRWGDTPVKILALAQFTAKLQKSKIGHLCNRSQWKDRTVNQCWVDGSKPRANHIQAFMSACKTARVCSQEQLLKGGHV